MAVTTVGDPGPGRPLSLHDLEVLNRALHRPDEPLMPPLPYVVHPKLIDDCPELQELVRRGLVIPGF